MTAPAEFRLQTAPARPESVYLPTCTDRYKLGQPHQTLHAPGAVSDVGGVESEPGKVRDPSCTMNHEVGNDRCSLTGSFDGHPVTGPETFDRRDDGFTVDLDSDFAASGDEQFDKVGARVPGMMSALRRCVAAAVLAGDSAGSFRVSSLSCRVSQRARQRVLHARSDLTVASRLSAIPLNRCWDG